MNVCSKILLAMTLLCAGCRLSTIYPMSGAVVGGGVGSVGGPATAAAGAGLGYAVGEIARQEDENLATIEALTEGDVSKIIEQQIKSEGGFFDQILTEVWGVLKLCAIGGILYTIVPMLYTRYIHKKIK